MRTHTETSGCPSFSLHHTGLSRLSVPNAPVRSLNFTAPRNPRLPQLIFTSSFHTLSCPAATPSQSTTTGHSHGFPSSRPLSKFLIPFTSPISVLCFFFLSWDLEQALVFYSCHVFLFSFSTRSSGRVDLGRGCQPVIVRILEFVSWLEPEARTWMRSRVGDDVRWSEPAFFPWLVEHGRAAVGAISHGYTR